MLAEEEMNRKTILIAATATAVLGFCTAMTTLRHRTFADIQTIYPTSPCESTYVPARGFPFPMWAHNTPSNSGYGEDKSAILWRGILGNWIVFTFGISMLEISVFAIGRFFVLTNGKP